MEQIIGLLGKLDPNQLILTIVLMGVYKIFDSHGKKVVSAMETLSSEVKLMASDIKGIREDLGEIVDKIEEHDDRIKSLEKKS